MLAERESVLWMTMVLSPLIGALGAMLIACYAAQVGLVDKPCDRSSHVQPTPKGGGIGILMAFVLVALVLNLKVWMWLPAVLLAIVSLIGDRRDINPILRLLLQFGAAICMLLGGYFSGAIPLLDASFIYFFVLMAVFIVGTANFYNFMDGINGIAGLSAVVAFGGLALFSFNVGEPYYALLNFCIALACAGFLPFNVPRAQVFMGDVGSILLGFVFASQVVLLSRSWTEFFGIAALLLAFYFDELTTMAIRLSDGEHLGRPHRRHLYQVLVNELHWTHQSVATVYALGQAMAAGLFLWLTKYGLGAVLLAYGIAFLVFCALTFSVRAKTASILRSEWK